METARQHLAGCAFIGSPRGQHRTFTGGRSYGAQLPPARGSGTFQSMKEGTMYAFAMMALLGLAVLAVTAIASRYLSISAEIRAFVLPALGVGTAWLINLDLFGVLAVATRDSAIAVTVTGLMIGGAAYFWQEILGFFAGLSRKLGDEAATLEKSEQLRRVA
jgi:hypothetical protein